LILLPAVLAGIVIALLRGGSLGHLANLHFRLGWLALLCLAGQLFVIYSPADGLEGARYPHAILLIGSTAALVLVVWANRRVSGMPILGLGLLLNLVVMSANGGFMPVSREAALSAGTRSSQEVLAEGTRLPKSKDILLPMEHTQLWFLSDAIVAPPPLGRVYSVGDLIVGAGVIVMLQAAMVPRRSSWAEKKSTAATA
jgi:hypothetical protein